VWEAEWAPGPVGSGGEEKSPPLLGVFKGKGKVVPVLFFN